MSRKLKPQISDSAPKRSRQSIAGRPAGAGAGAEAAGGADGTESGVGDEATVLMAASLAQSTS